MKQIRKKIAINSIAVIISVLFLFPLYWTLINSFRTESEIIKWPPSFIIKSPTLSNYHKIIISSDSPVFLWFKNSSIAAISYATLGVIISVMAAFALARLKFKMRDIYFKVILASMAIPPLIFLIPNYTTADALGWTDSLAGIIFPGLSATFGIFLLRQFFITIPLEFEEAAVMDGANIWWRIKNIIIPLSRVAIITLWVMNFMANWKNYLWALLILYSPDNRTLPVGMSTLQGRYTLWVGIMSAGAIFVAVPSIIIFLIVKRYFVKGINIAGAVKQ